ncbi:EAL domain-containing protein [Agrobacterium sp. a22-2]|uniref:EAL domain-containing protein n=1 Tax=Agrobacterium sp. a22-2 TaxID=2283840 RepID=UPI00144861A1|nr:EAL domain-containing protein [Agrobacterium sp. a22-2]
MQTKLMLSHPRLIWRLVMPLVLIVVGAFIGLSLYLPTAFRTAALDTAYDSNINMLQQARILRSYYGKTVAVKVGKSDHFKFAVNHANLPNAIPLPTTFLQEVAAKLGDEQSRLKLISPYSWPYRDPVPMSADEKELWETLKKEPSRVVSHEDTIDGKRYLHTAIADRMDEPSCVSCHNSDVMSPKRDWKLGDVRGILEISNLLEPHYAAAEKRSYMVLGSIGAVMLPVVLTLLVVAWIVDRRTREKEEVARRLSELTNFDTMTGVLTRQSFIDITSVVLKDKTYKSGFSIHLLNLGGVATANQLHGTPCGDQMIRDAVRRLREGLPEHTLIGRLGGNRFVVAGLGPESQAEVRAFVANLMALMEQPFSFNQAEIPMLVSIGSAIQGSDGERCVEQLLQKAEIALATAKHSPGANALIFDQAMRDTLEDRQRLLAMIEKALSKGGFELHYQSVHDAVTARIKGFEALIRLRGTDGRLIPPDDFISVAEASGAICEIGAWTIREACRVAANLPADTFMAVNLSPVQFRARHFEQPGIAEVVMAALAETGLPAHRLELEITEGLFLDRNDAVIAELLKLHEIGVSLAMDDFGTGYSSLSYLWHLPVDKIKLDRSFVTGWSESPETATPIIEAITGLAKALDKRMTVEGIETPEQAKYFADLGCGMVQGFYYSRPLPEADLAVSLLRFVGTHAPPLSDEMTGWVSAKA